MKKVPFKEICIGTASFANERAFAIFQIKKHGACRIWSYKEGKNIGHTSSIPAAWRTVRFTAPIIQKTERSPEFLS